MKKIYGLLGVLIGVFFLSNFYLVSAQDLKNLNLEEILPLNNNLVEKIETFKKVLDLALIEAKDLKINLTSLDKLNKEELELQTDFLKELNEVIVFYEKKKEAFLNQDNLDLQFLKNEAKELKVWRDENYLPLNKKIVDFILIKQQKKALEITKNRYQKIETDLKKAELKKIKNKLILNKINQLFEEAKKDFDLAESNYQKAEALFKKLYLTKKDLNLETASSVLSGETLVSDFKIANTPSSTETTSKDLINKEPEIKDLILDSFNSIKSVYKNFIEISKLFNSL